VNGEVQANSAWCERLYQAKAAELILYGRALGLSHSEAEDVLQETFAALLRRTEPPEQPDRYCVRSFRNQALNYRRSMWRRLKRELSARDWFEPGSAASSAETEAMKRLASLPPEQREVIVLKIWHDFTFEAIGELLAVSPNTVAGRYRYGLQKIRTVMKGTVYGRDERFGGAVALLDPASPVAES